MTLREHTQTARSVLEPLYVRMRGADCAAPSSAGGQLIRPLLCLAGARAAGVAEDDRFWAAAAALQLAHEASLLHDDVVDQAALRRNSPTLVAERGVAAALIEGDHLLTTGYRLAATTGSTAFVAAFAHAVERTVAGEKLQGRATGMVLDERSYRTIVGGKSGELLGCALAAAVLTSEAGPATSFTRARSATLYTLGRRLGTLYQMFDDLLDYCPGAATGKAHLADFRQRRWTWPLLELADVSFDDDADDVATRFASPDARGTSPLGRCLLRLEHEADMVRAGIAVNMPGDEIATALVLDWLGRAAEAVRDTERAERGRRMHTLLAARAPQADALPGYFREHSRSFSFAARLFPLDVRRSIESLYAFCRVTDDIADESAASEADRLDRLEAWHDAARRAYHGEHTGIDLLDDVMARAAAARVPFTYVDALIEGMRMDLRGETYATMTELRLYSYRVAGVIGQWVTRLCGVHDEAVLESAAALGHAMQLTNILRDVGEDLAVGRIYIPAATMREFGIDEDRLRAYRAGAAIDADYRSMIEQLMRRADIDYEIALDAAASLPSFFRRPVVVAAYVYRGIHDAIRVNGFDNITRRARTALPTKVSLAARALQTGWLISDGVADSVSRPARSPHVLARLGLFALFTLFALTATAPAVLPAAAQTADQTTAAAQHHERLLAVAAAAPDSAAVRLDLVRTLFLLAVEDESRIADGRAQIAAVRTHAAAFADSHAPLLRAYDGAFTALEAKHGVWPPSRLRAVRTALGLLDDAVRAAPDVAEIRYLRAVNTHYLPGLFGRGESARTDISALVRLLTTGHAADLPVPLRRAVAGFLVDSGRLAEPDAAAVRALLARTDGGRSR